MRVPTLVRCCLVLSVLLGGLLAAIGDVPGTQEPCACRSLASFELSVFFKGIFVAEGPNNPPSEAWAASLGCSSKL